MRTTPKYKAKFVFFDVDKRVVIDKDEIEIYRSKGRLKLPDSIVRFDSQHEFKVYLELCRMYGAGRIARQHPINIISPGHCYPKGKTWKVDFAVLDTKPPRHPETLIEAKGALLPEFVYTLALLEQKNPWVFENLCVVFGQSVPTENKVIDALSKKHYVPYFCTLKELEQLTCLPLPQ